MTEPTTVPVTGAPGRRALLLRLLISAVAVCAVVPVVVLLTGPLVGGWADTLGFGAGLIVASAGVAWVAGSDRAAGSRAAENA